MGGLPKGANVMRTFRLAMAVPILLFLTSFIVSGCTGGGRTAVPLVRNSSGSIDTGQRNSQLVFACGAAGMGVDFVTGNCVPPGGGQVNPHNVAPPFAPLPRSSPGDLIMRCGGRAVDFVTGRCM